MRLKPRKKQYLKTANQVILINMFTLRELKNCESVTKTTKSNWRLIVDDFTDVLFSGYYDRKDGMVEPTCEQFNLWKKVEKCVDVLDVIMVGEMSSFRNK